MWTRCFQVYFTIDILLLIRSSISHFALLLLFVFIVYIVEEDNVGWWTQSWRWPAEYCEEARLVVVETDQSCTKVCCWLCIDSQLLNFCGCLLLFSKLARRRQWWWWRGNDCSILTGFSEHSKPLLSTVPGSSQYTGTITLSLKWVRHFVRDYVQHAPVWALVRGR